MKKRFLSLLMATTFAGTIVFNNNVAFAAEAQEEVVDEVEAVSEEEIEDTRVIPQGITIQGMDVGGLTVTEANGLIKDYYSKYNDIAFTLSANDKTIEATGKDLCIGAKNKDVAVKAATYGTYGNIGERFKANADIADGRGKDFSLSLGVDREGMAQYLNSVSSQVNDDAKDNYVTREGGSFVFHEGSSGVVVQVDESVAIIAEYIENQWDEQPATIALSTIVKEPRGTKEDLAQITDLLGGFNTDYSTSSAARKNNVANAVGFINGTILYPGDEFSVINTITPFSAENGYQLAGSYENGTTVQTYGGGICQVSTTLYGAVRAAELAVVTRSCHSMIVTYVPPSQDAAIAESGGKDFQIRNNKNYPVYIEGYCDGNHAYFNIYGKEEDSDTHKVDYETEITGVNVQNTTWVADPNVPLGKMTTTVSGHTGYTARLWKVVYENGQEVSRDVYNNSKYNPSNRTVTVGIASPDANLSYAMLQAVNSQNPDIIANAIATYAPGVANTTPIVITPKYQITVKPEEETTEAAPAEAAPAEAAPVVPDTGANVITDNSEI